MTQNCFCKLQLKHDFMQFILNFEQFMSVKIHCCSWHFSSPVLFCVIMLYIRYMVVYHRLLYTYTPLWEMEILLLDILRQHIDRKGVCQCQPQSWPCGRATDASHRLCETFADKYLASTGKERSLVNITRWHERSIYTSWEYSKCIVIVFHISHFVKCCHLK